MLFKESLRDKAPKTIGSRLNAVKIFLGENSINFSKRFFKNMNGKVNQAITEERVPSNQELRRIIQIPYKKHCNNYGKKFKTLKFLVLKLTDFG